MRFRVLHRRWDVVVPMYQLRQCPDCAALVRGPQGQRTHEQWHEAVVSELEEETRQAWPEDGWINAAGDEDGE